MSDAASSLARLIGKVRAYYTGVRHVPAPAPAWPLMGFAVLLSLSILFASQNISSYFLQFDSPTHHLAGLLFAQREWAYSGNKALIMWMLAALNLVFGPHPTNELYLLTLLGCITAAALFDAAYVSTGSRRAALLTVIIWLSSGAALFHIRMHMGYPICFFMLGAVFTLRRIYAASSVMLLLAVLSHTSFVVPVAFWFIVSVGLGWGPRSAAQWAGLIAPAAAGYLAYEYIALQYTTEIWHTAKNFLTEISKFDAPLATPQGPLYLWHQSAAANGLPWTCLAGLSLAAYPFVARKTPDRLHLIYVFVLMMLAFYGLRAWLFNAAIVLRLLGAVYPLAALICAGVLVHLLHNLKRRSPASAALSGWLLTAALTIHLVPVMQHQMLCTSTAYPQVQRLFEQAAAENTPVIYFGNDWIGGYFSRVTGAEALIQPLNPPLAFEIPQRLQLAQLDPAKPVYIIWDAYAAITPAETAQHLTQNGAPAYQWGQAQPLPHPNAACIYHQLENPGMLQTRMQQYSPLKQALTPQPPPSIYVIRAGVQ